MILGDGKPKDDGVLDYFGVNDPAHKPFNRNNLETFSINVFRWEGGKKGKCIKQFKGYKDGADDVYKRAIAFINKGAVDDEYSEQKKIIKWARNNIEKYPELEFLSCSLNGFNRSHAASAMAIASGMVAGEPDLFLPVVNRGYHGLFIELKKVKGGSTSKEQKRWIEFLTKQGYLAKVIKGSQPAIELLQWYIEN
jgi:hypothetical protein